SGPAATVAASAACRLLVRNPGSGQFLNTTVQYDNLGLIDLSGLDLQIDWTAAFSDMRLVSSVPGAVNLHFIASYIDHYETQAAPGQPIREWKGTLGPTLSGTDPGVFSYRLNTSLGYRLGRLNVGINWRFLPSIHPSTWGQAGNN